MLGIKQTVAGALSKTHRLVSGVIRPTTTTVSGDFNGFTKDIAYLLPAAPTAANRSWVAILHGFADLSTGTTPGTTPTAFSGECKILRADQQCFNGGTLTSNCLNASSTWSERTCESHFGAGYQKIDAFPACAGTGVSFRATPVGQLSFNEDIALATGQGQCYTPCSGSFQCTRAAADLQGATWQRDEQYQDIRVNDASIARMTCTRYIDTNGLVDPWGGAVCGYTRFTQPWANSTILASNPKNVLCCKPD